MLAAAILLAAAGASSSRADDAALIEGAVDSVVFIVETVGGEPLSGADRGRIAEAAERELGQMAPEDWRPRIRQLNEALAQIRDLDDPAKKAAVRDLLSVALHCAQETDPGTRLIQGIAERSNPVVARRCEKPAAVVTRSDLVAYAEAMHLYARKSGVNTKTYVEGYSKAAVDRSVAALTDVVSQRWPAMSDQGRALFGFTETYLALARKAWAERSGYDSEFQQIVTSRPSFEEAVNVALLTVNQGSGGGAADAFLQHVRSTTNRFLSVAMPGYAAAAASSTAMHELQTWGTGEVWGP